MSGHGIPERLAVVGAGVMGTGIATLAVGHGLPVVLIDVDDARLTDARARVEQQLRLAHMMGSLPSTAPVGRLVTSTRLGDVAGSTSVIESITERAALKSRVLAGISAAVDPGTLLVSNTSAIPVDELAESIVRPEELVGIHFMNPPWLIRTVEVVRGRRSGEAALGAAGRLLAALDRDGVLVGDGPGFVINRILQRMINEAARIVEEGKATPEAVDAVFTGCLGHRTGPLATADLIGLDNVVDSLQVLLERTRDEGYRPSRLLMSKVHDGDFGRKTGRGFFEYGGSRS
jgi:methoxymalonate biosynthesis protein